MSMSSTIESDAAERRVYHAQLITCLAVLPTFTGLAALVTAASVGDRDLRALLLAHPVAVLVTLAIAMLFILAWWLLGRRHRAGVVLASALFAWMLASAVGRSKLSYVGIVVAALGLVAAVRAWPAMQRPARPDP